MERNDDIDVIIARHRADSFFTGVLVGAIGAFGIFLSVVLMR